MNKLEVAGRLIQWVIELSEFDVKYQLRSAIKAQVLADFIAEFTCNQGGLDKIDKAQRWVVYVDALLKGLELAKSLGVESVVVHGDSQLIINKVNGICEAKEDRMKKYLSQVKRLIKKFKEANFVQVPQEENMEADILVKVASTKGAIDEYDKVQYMSSIDLLEVQQIAGEGN
ncbi:uncharacterized protein LOC142644315 [Castanea sativa]|uniref:uncharacterized protein LOC142644315 n=1 Tax=Castanea sativa TaxID=21020 RepID=UPI003F64E8C8